MARRDFALSDLLRDGKQQEEDVLAVREEPV